MVVFSKGIPLKKKYGQHFLRRQSVVDHMLTKVTLNEQTSVFEIGPGDGFLTRSILSTPIVRLWVFEIDPDWAEHIMFTLIDQRLKVFQQNFLDIDFSIFESFKPWTVLSNLPYQVTFPILYRLQEHRRLIKEGVIMVQEEVAQKILKTHGRGYGYVSLFFQYYFEWQKMEKVPPSAFHPPPKVYSRLLYFKPKTEVQPIEDEEAFWKFIKMCFRQPRRTLRNNLLQTHIDLETIPERFLQLRAQQMSMKDFVNIWSKIQ